MARKRKFKERVEAVAHFIDLPPEAVAGSVGVRLVNDTYCTVENFKSIPVLTDERVILVCADLTVTVDGEGMIAEELSQGMAVLRGKIKNVSYKGKV